MQVSVETLKGLERKVTVSVPAKDLEKEVSARLKKLALRAKVDGFRPGKVPEHVIAKRYSDSVRVEVAQEMVQSTLPKALQEKDLVPAGYPNVELQQLEKGKDFNYIASFEVFPEFEVNELDKASIELIRSEVTDEDVKAMMEKLREQKSDWIEADHPAQKGNKVVIDFKGFMDDKPFEGGSAEGHELTLGSASMIPGFEEGIIGNPPGKQFDIKVNFPADYGHTELAGEEAVFKITLHKVMDPKLPELNDAFAENFNIKTGGIDALIKDIKDNMIRELERRVSQLNREKLFNSLMDVNKIDIPSALIEQEIENLKHEAYHRIFGHEHHENEKIPDFPRELFEEQAKRRVHLGLVFSEYVKKHEVAPETDRINAVIDKFASAYESPEELRQLYQNNKKHKAEIEALVLEEMVAEKVAADATVKYIEKDYDSVMNPQKGTENKGE